VFLAECLTLVESGTRQSEANSQNLQNRHPHPCLKGALQNPATSCCLATLSEVKGGDKLGHALFFLFGVLNAALVADWTAKF
jgi:hypothetical protein